MYIHGAGIALKVVAPHQFQKPFTGEGDISVDGKGFKELVLLWTAINFDAVPPDSAALKVNPHPGNLKILPLGLGAAEDRLHAGQHLQHFKGLDHVIVRPHGQATETVGKTVSGGQEDGGLFSVLLKDIKAIQFGQHDVQQHQVIGTLSQCVLGGFSIIN